MLKQGLALKLGIGLAFTLMASASHGESLLEIYHLAVGSDPAFRAAEAAHSAAQEALPQSRANFLPSVDLSASKTESDQDVTKSVFGTTGSSSFSNTNYTLSLNLPLYRKNNYVTRRIAKHSVARADAELNSARQDLLFNVAQAYFNVLSAADNLEFARAEKRAIQRQLEQTRQRFDVGLVAITDVHEAQARFDLAIASEIDASNALDNSRESLRTLTGSYHQNLLSLKDDTPLIQPEPTDIDQWTQTALTQNPALIMARKSVEEARESVHSQRATRYPTLDLTASRSYAENGGVFASTSETSSVGVRLNLSLYQGGRISSQTRKAQHLLEQAQQALEQQRRETQRSVRNAYLGVIAGISRVKALEQALISSQSALRASEAGYEVGTRTTVDVLNSRQEVFRAQRDHAQARYNYLLDTLRLKQAAGLLGIDDINAINGWLR